MKLFTKETRRQIRRALALRLMAPVDPACLTPTQRAKYAAMLEEQRAEEIAQRVAIEAHRKAIRANVALIITTADGLTAVVSGDGVDDLGGRKLC